MNSSLDVAVEYLGQAPVSLNKPFCVLQAPAQTPPQLLRQSQKRERTLIEQDLVTEIPQAVEKKAGGGRLGAGEGDPHLFPGLPQDITPHLLAQVSESWGHGCGPKGENNGHLTPQPLPFFHQC